MPNSMRIPFSARSSAAILISCGKTAFESKDESLRFWHSDARVLPFKSKTICRVAQRVNFTGMSDDLQLLRIPRRIRLLTLLPMLKFPVVLAFGRRHGCAASTAIVDYQARNPSGSDHHAN
jgi:hypothetical protein